MSMSTSVGMMPMHDTNIDELEHKEVDTVLGRAIAEHNKKVQLDALAQKRVDAEKAMQRDRERKKVEEDEAKKKEEEANARRAKDAELRRKEQEDAEMRRKEQEDAELRRKEQEKEKQKEQEKGESDKARMQKRPKMEEKEVIGNRANKPNPAPPSKSKPGLLNRLMSKFAAVNAKK